MPNARTAAHNQVCKVLAASLHKHLAAHSCTLIFAAVFFDSCNVQKCATKSDTTGHCLDGKLILWQYPTPLRKLLYDQRYADSLILKTCLRLIVESCRHMNQFKQHLKNTLPQDDQSWSFNGLWALGDFCMNNHYTILFIPHQTIDCQ